MNKIPYILFFTVVTIPFLTGPMVGMPRSLNIVVELFSALVFLTILAYGAYHKKLSISIKYVLLFFFICFHFLIGAVVNGVEPTTIIAGIRNYFKYLPLFLLPLVYEYNDNDIKRQLYVLLILGMFQFPIALFQKFVLSVHPDIVAGTFGIGSIMSLYLVCSIVILTGFYFKERINGRMLAILIPFLFIPTTINESKGTLFLMLLGLIVVMLSVRLKKSHVAMAVGALVVMLSTFTFIYNQSYTVGGKESLLDFMLDLDQGIGFYLYSGDSTAIDTGNALESSSSVIGAKSQIEADNYKIRRVDAFILPIRVLGEEPVKLMVGLGLGNASESSLKRFGFSGQYAFLSKLTEAMPALPNLLWEIGVLGVLLFLVFCFFVFWDSRLLAKSEDNSGVLAVGWMGVVVIIVLSLPYKNVMVFEAPSALFWYLSGYIVASCSRLRKEKALENNVYQRY